MQARENMQEAVKNAGGDSFSSRKCNLLTAGNARQHENTK
jgi:hypothetical protein